MTERDDAVFRAITSGLDLNPPDYRPTENLPRPSARIGYHLGGLAVLVALFVASSYLHLHGFWSGVRCTLAVSFLIDELTSAATDIRAAFFTTGMWCPHCHHRVAYWEGK